MQRCLKDAERRAAAELDTAVPPAWRDHLETCPRCRAEVEAQRALVVALAELGRADRRAFDGSRAWTALVPVLERPALGRRLPIGWAGAVRLAGDLARPALAAGVVAVAAGVGLGSWLAVTTARGLDPAPAADVLDDSNLAGAAQSGFESDWLYGAGSEASPASIDDTTSGAARTGGAPRESTP